MPDLPPRRSVLLAALVVGSVLVAIRVIGLDQYPRVHPDEGFWACGPRNLVLFGDGLMDGRLHPFLSPATFVLLSAWFSVFPPGLISARAFSVVAGLAACAVVGLLASREFPRRSWLLLFLFGLSSLTVLMHRQGLLEAHQTFWLVLAAVLWLGGGCWSGLIAGVAMGLALLVKSNSIYLLPAFLLTLPREDERINWRSGVRFFLACLGVAGGGYLLAWWLGPGEFVAAFRYELDGARFADEHVLVRIGRFGFHPPRALETLRGLFVTDGLLVILALLGLVEVLRHPSRGTRADRFFVSWLMLGACFHFGQVYVEHRYVTTLAPALAWLAGRYLDGLFGPDQQVSGTTWRRALAAGVLGLFVVFHLGRVGAGIVRQGNADYWQTVRWMRLNAADEDRVLAAPHLNLSLRQRSYDTYRMVFPYSGQPCSLDEIVARFRINWVIVDPEWRDYETPPMRRFLERRGNRHVANGDTVIYEVE